LTQNNSFILIPKKHERQRDRLKLEESAKKIKRITHKNLVGIDLFLPESDENPLESEFLV
jgi:hypothetical protein